MVQAHQLVGGGPAVVGQAGHQSPVPGALGAGRGQGDAGVDDPDPGAAGVGQPGPVGQDALDIEPQGARAGAHAGEEVRARGPDQGPHARRCQAPVGQDEHARAHGADQPGGQGGLADPVRVDGRGQQAAGGGGQQGHQADHRVAGARAPPGPALGEGGPVGLGVRHRDQGAVQGHDPARGEPVRAPLHGQGAGQQIEQRLEGGRSHPAHRLRDRRGAHGLHGAPQARAQARPHPAPPHRSEQRPRQQQVDHHPRRQAPHAPLHAAPRLQRRIDHLEGNHLGQLAQVTGGEHVRRRRAHGTITHSRPCLRERISLGGPTHSYKACAHHRTATPPTHLLTPHPNP